MKLAAAQEIAIHIASLLEPACAHVVIAGSIRRERIEVKDIELAALPLFGEDIFGAPDYSKPSCLGETIERLVQGGKLEWDTLLPRNGDKYKRFVFPGSRIAVDLFLASGAFNWGNTLAIRTGNAKFSEALVTVARRNGVQQKEGSLRRISDGKLIPCETEEAYFRALGLQFVPPRLRNDDVAEALFRGAYRLKGAA